jgi:hypothetical protein
MTFRDLFEDVDDWFWKLEFIPETSSYDLYLGIPNDWIFNDDGTIELIHQMETSSIIKISSDEENSTIDDILNIAKLLVSKNKELEKRKEEHQTEMERLRDELIEKEKIFLTYIDTVKQVKPKVETEEEEIIQEEKESVTPVSTVSSGSSKIIKALIKPKPVSETTVSDDEFIKDMENT